MLTQMECNEAGMRGGRGGWRRLGIRCAYAIALCASVALVEGPATPAARAAGTVLPTYLYGNDHSGYNSTETTITSTKVVSGTLPLQQKSNWNVQATDPNINPDSISVQPIVSNGIVYWGAWDGLVHATKAADGSDVWRTNIGLTTIGPTCSPPEVGVASTPTIATVKIRGRSTTALLLGGGDGAFYALDTSSGAVLWRTPLGSTAQGYFLWSSPALYNGSIYMGVASLGDCPLVPGQLVKLNPTNGAVQAVFNVVPSGCVGGGVWSAPTIDEAAGTVYISTGTSGTCNPANPTGQQYSQALVELRTNNLAFIGAWKVPPEQEAIDGDFGTTPTLFTATIGGVVHRMVGLANKNARYYAFDRDKLTAGPVWQTPPLSSVFDILASSAWDGTRLYQAVDNPTFTDPTTGAACADGLYALDPATGTIQWKACLNAGSGPADNAMIAVPGLVIAPIGSALYVVDAATGNVVFNFPNPDAHWFFSPATVANGVLYAPNSDGKVFAFSLNGQ